MNRRRRFPAYFFFLSFLAFSFASLGHAPLHGQVNWRSGQRAAESKSSVELLGELARLNARTERHIVVRFAQTLNLTERRALRTAGIDLKAPLGDATFFAALDPNADLTTILPLAPLVDVQAVERSWKLHPAIQNGDPSPLAVLDPPGSDDPRVALYVVFHRRIPVSVGRDLVDRHLGRIVSRIFSLNALVIEVPRSEVLPLADADPVQWIEPALPPMRGVNDSNRARTQANSAQAAPYGLAGSGVGVIVFDAGAGLASHADFGGRLTIRDNAGISEHATHVSGTIGGAGTASGGLYRGMAPAVSLESYAFQDGGSGIFLYSDPGDLESDYWDAVNNHGADIANNSLGTNVAINGLPCDITGDYGVTSALIDAIVCGSLGAPFRVIWANGNERQSTECGAFYATTAPPAGAKNHIAVGALNSDNDAMTSFSSWGPTDDGRLKPDVTAPGCQNTGDEGVTSTSDNGGYSTLCGTSMAAPTVTGLAALLVEDYRAQFPAVADPRNSTLKVFLAHTAQDLGNPGPDYQFGYGSVRATAAVDLLRSGSFLKDQLTAGEIFAFQIDVPLGTPELKVTLAWDDAPGTPNVNHALVNDLDLVVLSPSLAQAFPWTLDPAAPSEPADQNQPDHTNNIEQVVVEDPASGTWQVRILGFDVPEGPQTFSVATSPPLTGVTIQLLDGVPEVVSPTEDTEIPVLVRAVNDTLVIGSARFHYRYGNVPFQDVPLVPSGADLFTATLPAGSCGEVAEFYLSAEGAVSGPFLAPTGAPSTVYTAEVGELVTVFADDFEAGAGWTVGAAGDDAATGIWERVNPNGTAAQPEDDHTPGPGSVCFVTGQGTAGGSLGENDVDGGKTTLLTPILDLKDVDATIGYWRWYSNNAGATPNADVFEVEISPNGGSSWISVETVGPTGPGTSGGWFYHEFSVEDVISPSAQVQMRFIASDEGEGSLVEAAVDDFRVLGVECLADCNGNGIPDSTDIDTGASPDADRNGIPDECECSTPLYIRGNINGDANLDITDPIILLEYLFGAGPPPVPLDAGDVDGNGKPVGLADVIYLLNYLFAQGAPPPAPFPDLGCGD